VPEPIVKVPSPALPFDPSFTAVDRIDAMVDWFQANFDDPVNDLPYDGREGGYQWMWGGPFDATEELQNAFPSASEQEIAAAVNEIESDGVTEWNVAGSRVVMIDHGDAVVGPPNRRVPSNEERQKGTIVETVLYPRLRFEFSVRVTFIPGNTNEELGAELDIEDRFLATETGDAITTESGERISLEGGTSALVRRDFGSLRSLVSNLIDLELEGRVVNTAPQLEAARGWISSLTDDRQLFVDDSIAVHASPLNWASLVKMFGKGVEAGGFSAIVMVADKPGQAVGFLISYGGARLFLHLVHGVAFTMDSLFERLSERIRRGDFDSGDPSDTKPKPKAK